MKKFLAIILGAMVIMSFAASAFAIHAEIPAETSAIVAKGATQITLGGEVRFRGWYKKNITGAGAPEATSSQAHYDTRVRLSVDANVAPGVQGYVQLESGDSLVSDVNNWGNFNQHTPGFNILQSWILYKGTGLLGFNSGLKVGHMPLALGEKQFFDHTRFGDDAIVFFMDPTKELHVGLLTVKFAGDGNTHKAIPLAGVPASGLSGSAADNTNDTDGYVALAVYKLDAKNTIGANYTYVNNSDAELTLQNLGIHANGNISGFGYKAEADIQFGEFGASKFKGLGLLVAANYMIDPANLRASFAYGSGNDGGSDIKAFIPFVSELQNYTLIYEYLVASTAGAKATGISNTTYFNVGADFTPAKDFKASIDGYILRASKAAGSKEAGWEVDGKVAYNVAKNLTYQVDAGYFKAGDFYGTANKGVSVLRHMMTLSF
ncbi:MAG: alginate export family protein [Thermodesulfovibrionales bacterium]